MEDRRGIIIMLSSWGFHIPEMLVGDLASSAVLISTSPLAIVMMGPGYKHFPNVLLEIPNFKNTSSKDEKEVVFDCFEV